MCTHYGDYEIDWKELRRKFWEPVIYPPIIYNTTKKSQVVTATINSALSRQREPESDPVRLQDKGGEKNESSIHAC